MANSNRNRRFILEKGNSNCIVPPSLVSEIFVTDRDPAVPSILMDPVEQIIARFENPEATKSQLAALTRHPEILQRLSEYADHEPKLKYQIAVRSFSKIKRNDILRMGVEMFPDIPFSSLVHVIRQSSLDEDFEFKSIPAKLQFTRSVGDKAFKSISEDRARVGIYKIMSEIISRFQERKAFLVEENIGISRLRTKVPPVEVQHERDGVLHSFFLTGVLDFLCCSSNIHELSLTEQIQDQAFEDWYNSSAVPPAARWKNINDFLLYVADRTQVFDRRIRTAGPGGKLPRWQLLVIEAKSMDERSTSQPDKSQPQVRDLPLSRGLKTQNPFLLDPDQWLLAYKNLNSLLPSGNNNTGIQLHHMVLDRYLSLVWHSSKHDACPTRYMPFDFLQDTGSELKKSDIDRFREISGLPPSAERCPLEPVVGVIHHNDRYLVVVVPHVIGDTDNNSIYILGDAIEPFDRYVDKHRLGQGEWKRLLRIGYYHDWDMEDYQVHHIAYDQTNEDSGPVACEITRNILKNGFYFNKDIPTYWCTHNIRLDILATIYKAAVHLARFPQVLQSTRQQYPHGFDSRLEEMLEEFWNDISDLSSESGFVSISKNLARSMATCRHCRIKFACDDLGADDNDDINDGDEDDLEMQEIEAHLSKCSTPDSSVRSLIDEARKLGISESQSDESHSNIAAENPNTVPQHPPRPRSLKRYVYQAIAESLALHLAPKPERFQEDIMKFCVSSSEAWIFGVIDCTQKDCCPCYVTDTLTNKFFSGEDSANFDDIITLLLTWMCVPAEKILPYMKECVLP